MGRIIQITKLKNIKFSKDLYNSRNNNNFDLETKDNINNTNVKKIKVLNVQNNRLILAQFFSNTILNIILTDLQYALISYVKEQTQK